MADSTLHALTEDTDPTVTAELYLLEDPAGTPLNRRISVQNLLKVINNLTADATPDRAADYVVTYDASASASKKVLVGTIATSGTYTPTLTNTTNIDSSTVPSPFAYMRTGSFVMVSGGVTVDPTAAASTVLGISLPIASNFAAALDATGNGTAQTTNTVGSIAADTTNDRVTLTFVATNTASTAWRVMFMYQII